MKKTVKALLAMVMAVILVFSAIPVSAASVAENFNAVVAHINSSPNAYEEEDGYKSLSIIVEEDGDTAWWYIWNQSNGIKFGCIIIDVEGSQQEIVQTEFLLRKSYYTVNVDFFVGLRQNNQDYYYDGLEVSKSFDRRKHTVESEYTGFSASTYGYLSAEDIQDYYNVSLQTICLMWNSYFINNLGFGLDGLGFTKYECPHNYDDDCDTDCNLCGETRETEHSYGAWIKADENNHSHTCGICNDTQTEAHKWSVEEIIKMPTEEEDGIISFVCNDCDALKTEDVPYKPGDLEIDGSVDNKDVEYLLWHTLYPEDYILSGNGDFVRDGFVDNKDVEYLLWYTLFPEDYPLV